MIPADLDTNSPLWQFALEIWHLSLVRERCLELQDSGWSITRVLAGLWLTTRRKKYLDPDTDNGDRSATQWRQNITEPLRNLRQSLEKGHPVTDALRQHIATAELEAERVELALVFRAVNSAPLSKASPAELLEHNLTKAAPPGTSPSGETLALFETALTQMATEGRTCS